MTNFRTGVEFGTNVGVLERDYQRATRASSVFGEKAQADLASVTVAEDKLSLASQRVAAAQTQLVASQERLNAARAAGTTSTGEMAAAQTAFVASQERLLAAQTAQARLIREQQTAVVAAPARPGGAFGGTAGLFAGLAATEAALKIKDAIEQGARLAAQSQAIGRQIDVTLESTGNVANTSADHIHRVAEETAAYTGILPNTIAAGQLLELTFTGIRNEGDGQAAIFDRTAQAAANMAVGLHLARGGAIDYQGSMQLLARAVNDPVAGMTMLRRAGVSFTAEQRDQIKTLAESGHLLQAQAMIIDLVNQKFGDAAKTFGQGAEGGLARWHVAVDELEKTLAGPMLHVGVPALQAFSSAVQFLTAHPLTVWSGEAVIALTGVVFAVAALEHAMRFLRESQWLSSLGKWLFGYRTLGRTITTVEAAEAAQGAAAIEAADAENLHAAAMERSTIAARELAGAEGLAARGGLARGAAGLLGGVLGGTAGTVGGAVAGAAAIGVGVFGLVRAHQTSVNTQDAITQLEQLRARTPGGFMNQDINSEISRLNRGGGGVFGGGGFLGLGANGSEISRANTLIAQLRTQYKGYLGDLAGGESVLAETRLDHRAIADSYVQQRDAVYSADLAEAEAAQHRADRLQKAFSQARALQHAVVAGNATAVHQIEQMIGVGQAGLFDLVDPNAVSAKASAASSLTSAQTSATSAQRSVVLAEARLQNLRSTGKATAYQLQSAESSLANARDRAAGASDRLTASEKKVHDAQTSSLSVAEVLKRAAGQDENAQSLAAAARRLTQLGVREPVMQELLALDQQAPGTFARIAAHLTQAGAARLNRDERIKNAARHTLEEAFAESNTRGARDKAAQAGTLAAQAWEQAYRAALRDPKFWELVNTELGRLLAGNLHVLPKGNPGAGGTGTTGPAPSLPNLIYPDLPKQQIRLPHGLAGGGWTSGSPGQVSGDYVHGGEYVLSRDMLAGRQPIGVNLGMASASRMPPTQVVVHVHTAAPSYSQRHEWHNTIKAASPREFERWADDQHRVRSMTP